MEDKGAAGGASGGLRAWPLRNATMVVRVAMARRVALRARSRQGTAPQLSRASHCRATASAAEERPLDEANWRRKHKYAVKLAYDGGNFAGFQLQAGVVSPRRTVQGELERCLTQLTGAERAVLGVGGVGRTDTGVHALAQWVHFWAEAPLRAGGRKLMGGLNGLMDADVRCHDVKEVPPQFHARRSALQKEYRYYIDTGPHLDPLRRHTALHLHQHLDMGALSEACARFEGMHDFSAFANSIRDRSARQTTKVRTIAQCTAEPTESGVVIVVRSPGFLYRQVRNMVGTLVRCGSGKVGPEEVTRLLEGQVPRSRAPKAAPAHGLVLHDVTYPSFVWDMDYCAKRGDDVYREILELKGIDVSFESDSNDSEVGQGATLRPV